MVETAKLTVSGPSDGSFTVSLYVQNQLGEDAGLITDWSAIPAGATYRLAVSVKGSYKITSGTVLTCNGAVVTPYTTTQGISYVYHLTPAAGDVYALTVATEANSSGGGTEEPEVTTASLSVVSAPSDGSYSAVLYAQTESGTDGNVVDDWSAIPAGATYRLAVTATGSYKIASGTVLTCNGATVAPTTTTQGISYVYHLTPAAGDVYALTVATEANSSGGGTEEPEVTVPDGEYALELVYGATGTADSNELDASSGTYEGIVSSLGRNHMISKLIPYDAGKTYVFTAVATTYTAHVQLVSFDESGNYMGASPYGSNSAGSIETLGTHTFTLSGGTLTPSLHPTDTWSMPGNASKIAIFGRTKGNCATNVPAGKEYLALTLEISSV